MTAAIDKCMGCPERWSSATEAERESWNGMVINGRLLGVLCPACQTPAEAQEGLENLAAHGPLTATIKTLGYLVRREVLREWVKWAIESGAGVAPPDAFVESSAEFVMVFSISALGGPADDTPVGVGIIWPLGDGSVPSPQTLVRLPLVEFPLVSLFQVPEHAIDDGGSLAHWVGPHVRKTISSWTTAPR
jgi:hypothetical protein